MVENMDDAQVMYSLGEFIVVLFLMMPGRKSYGKPNFSLFKTCSVLKSATWLIEVLYLIV